MPIYSALLLTYSHIQSVSPFEILQKLAQKGQKFCNSLSPTQSDFVPIYKAIVCGERLLNAEYLIPLQDSNLLHLAVVSGGHLQTLALFLSLFAGLIALRGHGILTPAVLGVYSLLSGAQPPVIRALFDLAIKKIAQRYKLFIPEFMTSLYSGVICLLFFPQWSLSLSLVLSWLASLSISALPQSLSKWSAFACYAVLLLPLSTITTPHPLGILFNILLAPVLSLFLFPICLISFVLPWFVPISDWFIEMFFTALNLLTKPTATASSVLAPTRINYVGLWLYVCLIQLLFWGIHKWKK